MASLDSLKQALRAEVPAMASSSRLALSDEQYSTAFDILMRGSAYLDFIMPQLAKLLAPVFDSRSQVSVLEIGPGPKSVLGCLPDCMKEKIRRYTAFEPNFLFATRLEEWFENRSTSRSAMPNLEGPPVIRRLPFVLKGKELEDGGEGAVPEKGRYDIVVFCHSMYGMKPKKKFVEQALGMLVERSPGGIVAVIHRDSHLNFGGLVCHQTASFPTGEIRVANDDKELDSFSSFIAGFVMQDIDVGNAVQAKWRNACRCLGLRSKGNPDYLSFHSPEIMVSFTRHAKALQELVKQVPQIEGDRKIKNREAQAHDPASILSPTKPQHVQQCVLWALKYGVGLTVIGGSHSGHCIWPNVVSIDMSAFNKVHILIAGRDGDSDPNPNSGSLAFVEAGCKTGDVIRETMAVGHTIPLGARPSVGAGLWLQGGIGHLSRLYGLACDAIVGAVIVSVKSGQVLCIGSVPSQHWPADAIRPAKDLEDELLWAVKGAGTNFGVVIGVTCRTFPAPTFETRSWILPLHDEAQARQRLRDFDRLVAGKLPPSCSADAYMYSDAGQLHLGVTTFEALTTGSDSLVKAEPHLIDGLWGPGTEAKGVDGVELFDADMYVSGMHGGHAGSKTSSFKRCLFLKRISRVDILDRLILAIEARPLPLCYLHLLHGGRAVSDVPTDATAFGCRDWDFACVITGVWPRDRDGTGLARSAIDWVYKVVDDLLSLSCGVYSADLGPDPRDTALAAKAFGPNLSRLARLKRNLDPHGVLAYACPIPRLKVPKFILLVTGESCSGKDHCAGVWRAVLARRLPQISSVRVVSISDSTKREFAAATGADLSRLLNDRAYKELHRPALTAFFQEQALLRPQLPEEHFLDVVYSGHDSDILLITGMREQAPVAKMSHLVPESRLLEVHIQASEQTRRFRREGVSGNSGTDESDNRELQSTALEYQPSLTFSNGTTGNEEIEKFAARHLLPFFHTDLDCLAHMARSVPNFPCLGIEFRHILDISQQPGGLALCTSLLRERLAGGWPKVDAVVSCEAGGFVFASALASWVDVPMVLIRETGKLPPPTISVSSLPSHVKSLAPNGPREKRIEMERDAVPRGALVVVVDDVLATGETLHAVLRLLEKAGIRAEDISVLVVAEFPAHRGRGLLHERGFGRTNIQSLLVFGGA